MDVFGLEPIQATIVIAIIGVGLQVGLGFAQSTNPFDGRKLLTSAIIALVASFTIGTLQNRNRPSKQIE